MPEFNIEDVKSVVVGAVEEKTGALAAQLDEVKNELADLEAKSQAPVQIEVSEVKFDKELLNAKLRDVFTDGAKDTKLEDIDCKGLAIGGTGGESLAIDEELGRRVIEKAREQVAILGLIGSKSVGSVDYREMVLRNYPGVAKGTEQIAGTNWAATGTQTYEEIVMNVGKQYAKPFISDEAINDPHIDLMSHLTSLLADEMSRRWAQQVLAGDGTTGNLRGMLSSNRLDAALTASGESYKAVDTRDNDFYFAVASGVDGDLGADSAAIMDTLIDVTVALQTAFHANAKWVMNRRTLGAIRKLRDSENRPLIKFEESAFNLLGYPVVVEDYMPDYNVADAAGIMFGDLERAYCLVDIDDKFLVDPYSLDGAVQLKQTSRKGELVQNNDAIVVLVSTDGVA